MIVMTITVDPKSPRYAACLTRLLALSAIVLLVLGSLYLWRVPILIGLAEFLTIDDQPQQADIIYILSGDVESRPFHAATLYAQGVAPKIVIPVEEEFPSMKLGLMPNRTKVMAQVLMAQGVPEEQIILLDTPGGVTSTWDETVVLREYIQAESLERVVIVTTAFHTRRARWIFSRQLDGLGVQLGMSPAEDRQFNERNWWLVEAGLITYVNEYIKFVFYLYRY